MRAALVRVGIDQAYGAWNAPVDPKSGEFVYVPIPEGANTRVRPALATTYDTVEPVLRAFASRHGVADENACSLPFELKGAATHPGMIGLAVQGLKPLRRGRRRVGRQDGGVDRQSRRPAPSRLPLVPSPCDIACRG